ncbi:MAG: DNA polymerase I, partial [Defluviitaleaceae bacterium]|nr:DNA polymerase I [Defluviitaleaceae bacterium]
EKPEYVGVCFDVKGGSFRDELFEQYKGHRKSMPDEMREQMPVLKELLTKMNINVFGIEGFEADDVLGTLAKKSEAKGLAVTLVSGDRDLLQIASENIKIRIPKTKSGQTLVEDYLAKDILEQFGVTPNEFIDVKALMGDSSDNIPGVPGIGEKTALKIIKEFKNIENAIENYEKIKPERIGRLLYENRELAFLSKKLSIIVLDAPAEIPSKKSENIFNELAFEEFKRLELNTLVSKYFDFPAEPVAGKIDYNNLDENGKVFNFAAIISEDEYILNGKLVSESKLKELESIIALDSKKFFKKGFTNVSFDLSLAYYVLNIPFEMPALKGKKRFDTLSEDEKIEFINSHMQPFEKYEELKEALSENRLYYNIEFPLAKVLADMEQFGIKIDIHTLNDFDAEIGHKIDVLGIEIRTLAGEEFNINSPSQLGVILFEKLGLKGAKKTKTGYSTAADVLEKLKDKHEIIPKILEYRMLAKLKSTYCEGLAKAMNPFTNKIHGNFNQTGAATGRLSMTEPNLQNIPIRTELGRNLRKIFIPSDDSYIFLDADYSQIELRILAHFAKDPIMIEAYKNEEDIHKITAATVLGKNVSDITEKERSSAKAINFGIIYGMGGFSLSEDLKITKKEADVLIEAYFLKYPSIKAYLDSSIEFATENGYAETLFGRKRLIPELKSKSFFQRGFGERMAMNTPLQGTAADIIKIAMLNVHNRLKKENLKSRLILTVHDELIVEAKKTEKEQAKQILKEEMERAAELLVPLVAEVNEGETWYDSK